MEKTISRKTIASRSGITWKDILFYAMGDFGNCFVFAISTSLLNAYYTKCLAFNPLYVIIIFAIARIWDAVNDPIMGRIADKMKPNKHGKYKRWLLYMALPAAIVSILMMIQMGPMGKDGDFCNIWWQYLVAGITYILYGMTLTAIQIPYGSLINAVTADAKERGKLSMARGIAGSLGGLPVILVKMFCLVDKKVNPTGFEWQPMIIGVAILGVFSAIFLFLCYKYTKERNIAQPAPREKGAFKKSINRIVHNRSMLSICTIAILLAGGSMFGAVISVFVSTDFFNMSGFNTGLPDILNIGGIFLTMFFVPPMAKKFGKKEATTMGALFCVVIYILQLCIFWLPHQTEVYPYYLYVLCNFLSGLGSGFFNCLLWGMVGDAIDDIYIKTGIREDGTSYSILMFFRKVGQTVAFCGGQGILIAIGYVSGVKLSESQLTMFWFLSNGIPLVCFVIAVLLFIFWYPINKNRLEEIQDAKELMLRKEESGLKANKKIALNKAK
ncbi:MAG: glycoside-pentoside-hexuronide (GPH):cation symporter [Bacilli bacterium]|nr:glycoside-pentoside-hexuronide (GPH):cation symporter [Bacilli bacterium]